MAGPRFVPLELDAVAPERLLARAREFRDSVTRRRTVREFSDRPVPRAVIEACLEAAGSAPSGANMQPWHFVVVQDPEAKRLAEIATFR